MGFSFSAFMTIFPVLIISGILSLLFFLELRNLAIRRNERPLFILVRGDSVPSSLSGSGKNYTELNEIKDSQFFGIIKSVQLVMLTVNVWILLTILLLPSAGIDKILPVLSTNEQYLVYSALGAIFIVSFLSTVILRISNTKPKMIATLGIIASGIFLLFFIPSMQWLSAYSMFVRGLILYAIIAASLFLTYGFFTLPSMKIEKVSIAGTIALYVFTSAVLFTNLVQSLQL